jgi:hypothetical protein
MVYIRRKKKNEKMYEHPNHTQAVQHPYLHFEDFSFQSNSVKGAVERFEQYKYVFGFSRGRPIGKASQIGKHDGGGQESIRNGFAQFRRRALMHGRRTFSIRHKAPRAFQHGQAFHLTALSMTMVCRRSTRL